MNKFYYPFLILPIIVFSSSMAHASATVAGCCNSSGLISSPMDVSLAATDAAAVVNSFTQTQSAIINTNIQTVGQAIVAEISKNRSAMEKLFENQMTNMHKFFTGLGMAQAELQTQEKAGKFARFDSLCVGPEVGAGVQVGKKAEDAINQDLLDDIQNYDDYWRNSANIIAHHNQKDKSKFTGDLLFPVKKTIAPEDLPVAQDMIELIINPRPDLQLSEETESSKSSAEYRVLQKQKKSLLAIPKLVFTSHLAAVSPTLPLGDQAAQIYQQMGNTGTPDSVVDGKISPYAFLELKADSRFGNPNWYAEMAKGKSQEAMLAELLDMNATSLEIQNRTLELQQYMALMQAKQVAMTVHATLDPVLEAEYLKNILKKNKK